MAIRFVFIILLCNVSFFSAFIVGSGNKLVNFNDLSSDELNKRDGDNINSNDILFKPNKPKNKLSYLNDKDSNDDETENNFNRFKINIPANHLLKKDEKINWVKQFIKRALYEDIYSIADNNLQLLCDLGMTNATSVSSSDKYQPYILYLIDQKIINMKEYDLSGKSLFYAFLIQQKYDCLISIFKEIRSAEDYDYLLSMPPLSAAVRDNPYADKTIRSILESSLNSESVEYDIVSVGGMYKKIIDGLHKIQYNAILNNSFKIQIPDHRKKTDTLRMDWIKDFINLRYDELNFIVSTNLDLLRDLKIVGDYGDFMVDEKHNYLKDIFNFGLLHVDHYDFFGNLLLHSLIVMSGHEEIIEHILDKTTKENIEKVLEMAPEHPDKKHKRAPNFSSLRMLLNARYPDLLKKYEFNTDKDDGIIIQNDLLTRFIITIPSDLTPDEAKKKYIKTIIQSFPYTELEDVINYNIALLEQYNFIEQSTKQEKTSWEDYLIELIKQDIIPLDKVDHSELFGGYYLMEVLLQKKDKKVLQYILEHKKNKIMPILSKSTDSMDHTKTIGKALQDQFPDLYKIISEEYEIFLNQANNQKNISNTKDTQQQALSEKGNSESRYFTLKRFSFLTIFMIATAYTAYYFYQQQKKSVS